MALKYTLIVNSQKQQDWTVEIDFPSYSGAPIALIGDRNPILIEYNGGSSDNPFDSHIITQSATFRVYDDGLNLFELQTISDASVVCRVYLNGQLKHQGFIVSDGVQSPDSGVASLITIKSIDGLELMDNIEYQIDNYGAITVDGRVSELRCPMNIIRSSLYATNNLNNKLPIRWASSLRSVQFPNNDMLAGREQLAYDGKILLYADYSVRWYLDNILRTAQCWLYQRDGYWYIENRGDTIRNGGFMVGYEITTATTAQVATPINIDMNTGEIADLFINQDAYWMVKKPLGGVDVVYNSTLNTDNVLPNGDMDSYSLGALTDWSFKPVTGSVPSYLQYESLSQREGYAVQLTNDGSATAEAIFSMNYTLPVDTWKLFKTMLFGFTFMPTRYGFPYNSEETINWASNPLKISISFTYQGQTWYLNEFGFWQNVGRGLNLGVQLVGITSEPGPQGTVNRYVQFEGSPNIGDVLEISVPNGQGTGATRIPYSFTVTPLEENNLQLALDRLLANIPTNIGGGQSMDNRAVQMQSPTLGRIRYRTANTVIAPTARTYKSGATQPYQYIYPFVDQLKIDDVATVALAGKGGNNEILMPQIESYGTMDGFGSTNGRLQFEFYVKPGQVYVIDDVYARIQNNNDLYKIRDVNSKSPIESAEVNISSSFSGFMLSSYMSNYGLSDRSLYWVSNGVTASLTELYGRFILDWRRIPRRIFDGSIDDIVQCGDFLTIKSVKYIVMNASIQGDGITRVLAFEAALDSGSYAVTHIGTNDDNR